MKFHLPVGGEWETFSDEILRDMVSKGKERLAQQIIDGKREYELNPLSFFLPHGIPWSNRERKFGGGAVKVPASDYHCKHKNDGLAMINDWSSDIAMMIGPRKSGKTIVTAAKVCLFALETKPDWPCYTEHGVEYRPWDGPKIVVISSFSHANLRDLWNVYLEILPRYELGNYAPRYGQYPGEKGSQKYMSFGDGRPKSLTCEVSGTTFIFLCYSQRQHVWESFRSHAIHADEQIPKNLLVAWQDGTRTMGDYTPAFMSLTGYVLDDRPNDTGAAGWIHREVYGRNTWKSKTVSCYHQAIRHVPDVFISAKRKREMFSAYFNNANLSEKDKRRAVASLFGGWESGSGMVFGPDVWQREIHVINPMWKDDATPRDWTKWRVIDYGDTNITCCSWWAVGPDFAVLYRLLYERDLRIHETCRMIIEMSHNRREMLSEQRDEETGNVYQYFKEVQTGEQFYTTLLDSRSCSQKQQGQLLEDTFSRYGLEVQASCGQKDMIQIPRLKDDWLRIDMERDHPFRKDDNGEPVKGCPNLFFFDGKTDAAIAEIEGLGEDPNDSTKINKKHDHHAIDTAKWFASDDPRYMGDKRYTTEEDSPQTVSSTPFTGAV